MMFFADISVCFKQSVSLLYGCFLLLSVKIFRKNVLFGYCSPMENIVEIRSRLRYNWTAVLVSFSSITLYCKYPGPSWPRVFLVCFPFLAPVFSCVNEAALVRQPLFRTCLFRIHSRNCPFFRRSARSESIFRT